MNLQKACAVYNEKVDLEKAVLKVISGSSFAKFTAHHLTASGQTEKISIMLVDNANHMDN